MKRTTKDLLNNNGIALLAHVLMSYFLYLTAAVLDDVITVLWVASVVDGVIGVLMLVAYFVVGKTLLRKLSSTWQNAASVLILPLLGVGFFSYAAAWGVFFYGYMAPWVLLSIHLHHELPYFLIEPPTPPSIIVALCLYSFLPALLMWWGVQRNKRHHSQ